MPYIKRIASIVNGADACGGGMKKQGLVYGSDHASVKGNHVARNTAIQYKFTLPGQADKTCCGKVVDAVSTYTKVRRTLLNN